MPAESGNLIQVPDNVLRLVSIAWFLSKESAFYTKYRRNVNVFRVTSSCPAVRNAHFWIFYKYKWILECSNLFIYFLFYFILFYYYYYYLMKKSDILSDSCRKRNFIPTLLSQSIKNLWFLVLKTSGPAVICIGGERLVGLDSFVWSLVLAAAWIFGKSTNFPKFYLVKMAQNHFRHNQIPQCDVLCLYSTFSLWLLVFLSWKTYTHLLSSVCVPPVRWESQIGDAESGADIKYTWTLLVCQVSTGWRTAKTEKTHQTRYKLAKRSYFSHRLNTKTIIFFYHNFLLDKHIRTRLSAKKQQHLFY